jgi:uncharacterized RDD family membrane protein YckC
MNTTVPPSSFLFAHPYTPPPTQVRVLAGFWRRVIALVLDGVVAGLPCLVLGLVFQRFFSTFPAWGAFIGFVITLCYFSFLASSAVDGQTFGMILTKIEVVNRDGSYVALSRSFLRYSILLAPFALNVNLFLPSRVAEIYSFVVSLTTLAIVYFFLFNRRTRQSIHDLATDTFVVEAPGAGMVKEPRLWRGHWVVVGAVAVIGFVAAEVTPRLSKSMAELKSIQDAIVNTDPVRSAGVRLQSSGGRSGIIVEMACGPSPGDYEKTAGTVAAIVLNADPAVASRDYLAINCVDGFQIGFAKKFSTKQFSHSPEEWQLINGK